ncbi:MAG: hypothetical protein QGG64_02675 [Candidatus Latescibacteria bacterium]|jgi:hypothetical protein|nr:hypothetical protein [Candidatus Latescibacterota bacterium]
MAQTLDIGRRIELVPMDGHFEDITVGLYVQENAQGIAFLVHTYSQREGAQTRIDFLKRAMQTLGGMEETADGLLRFPCGDIHLLAVKRLFLDACKIGMDVDVEVRSMTILDKKSGLHISANSLSDGGYQITADQDESGADRRIKLVAGGLAKLGELDKVEDVEDQVKFRCGASHDGLVGVLLVRAPNVRSVLRELEQAAGRGVLAAPSAQN